MTYSIADTAKLKTLAKQQNISLSEATKLVEDDMKLSTHDFFTVLKWYTENPDALAGQINGYNQRNPSDQVVPGRAQKVLYATIGGGVLLAVVVAWVIWKKVLKK